MPDKAVYVCFGEALGYMIQHGGWIDVHGAGAQRSDPKDGDPADYPTGHGPQGDAIRIYNYVRCVREVTGEDQQGMKGDANEDGSINVLDVLAVIRHILGAQELQGDALTWADCDGNEKIDVLDALGIVNVILGISECVPEPSMVKRASEILEILDVR